MQNFVNFFFGCVCVCRQLSGEINPTGRNSCFIAMLSICCQVDGVTVMASFFVYMFVYFIQLFLKVKSLLSIRRGECLS